MVALRWLRSTGRCRPARSQGTGRDGPNELGARAHITVQVLPFAAGGHAEAGGSLTLYTLSNQPTVAYEEGSRSGTVIEGADEVAERRESYDLLRAMALSPRDSGAMIRAAMEEWTRWEPPRI
ncbi:Scr1 family TA system antitoxin-like transcriptional regulator [Streptomyces sp. NPDC002446]